MSKYTTGEIAKLCGVSVRTVQYYDTRGILVPSEFSEGGRRLYSESDLRRMKIICFLRELDLPINSIGELLSEEHPEEVIKILLEEKDKVLKNEIEEKKIQLEKIEELRRSLKLVENFSVESIGDVAYQMENKRKLRKIRAIMLGMGIALEIAEISLLIYAVKTGMWWPYLIGFCFIFIISLGIAYWYMKNVDYICPQCHTIFQPSMKDSFWAKHTPNTRKLTCTHCGHHGFCVEVYKEERKNG